MQYLNKVGFVNKIPKINPPIMIQKGLKSILSPSLYHFFFKSAPEPRVSSIFFNRYTFFAIATIGARVAMRMKTRANIKGHTPISKKRALVDENDLEEIVAPVDVESGDEQSGVLRSGLDKSGKKRVKSEEKGEGSDFASRKVILGKPLSGKAFHSCGIVKLFSALGFKSFLVDSPKICYPSLVREFYGNLTEMESGQVVSFVNDTKITLSPLFLNAILKGLLKEGLRMSRVCLGKNNLL